MSAAMRAWHAVLTLTVLCVLAGIWGGDDRWFYTGLVLGAVSVPVVLIYWIEQDR